MTVGELLNMLHNALEDGLVTADFPVVIGDTQAEQEEINGATWGTDVDKNNVVWLTPTPMLGRSPTALA